MDKLNKSSTKPTKKSVSEALIQKNDPSTKITLDETPFFGLPSKTPPKPFQIDRSKKLQTPKTDYISEYVSRPKPSASTPQAKIKALLSKSDDYKFKA